MTIGIWKSSLAPFFDGLLRFRRAMRPHPLQTYGYAIGLAFIAIGLRAGMNSVLPSGFPFMTFFPIVTVAAFLFGVGPAILCAAICAWAAWFFFLGPSIGAAISREEMVALCYFIGLILIEIVLVDQLFYYVEEFEQAHARAVEHARQRDLLFTELQHRVGNNLAVVSSMLNLQARAIESQSAKLALRQSAGRIGLIADINRMFHEPTRVDGVFDAHFVNEIVGKCVGAYGAQERVKVLADVQTLELGQEYYLPLALILTECVNNALEHGIGDKHGELKIAVCPVDASDSRWRLSVKDNGSGLSADFNLAESKSIGLKLVKYFAQKLNGDFKIYSDGGVVVDFVFQIPPPSLGAIKDI